MFRLLKLVVNKENKSILNFGQKKLRFIHTNKLKSNLDEDTFGISSKYANLDSSKSKLNLEAIINNRNDSKKVSNPKTKFKPEIRNNLIKDDSDSFGTLTNEFKDISFLSKISSSKPSEEEKKTTSNESKMEKEYDKILNHVRLSNDPNEREFHDGYYGHKMKTLAKQGKIKEAIDIFFIEMIEKDRFKPTLWLYKTLINILADAGYPHMVFTLFKKLTSSRDDEWKAESNNKKLNSIITLLFHACSKSQWPKYSIIKTDSIRFYLKNRNIIPNKIQYAAMISSYGRAGAIYEAFNCVDEMIMNKVKPNLDVFNNLLCACISQPDNGLKYALSAWQMCLKYKLTPNITTYNLLLKAAKDCKIKKIKTSKIKTNFTNKTISSSEKNLFPINTDEFKLFNEENDEKNLNENNCSNLDSNYVQQINDKINDEVSEIKIENVEILKETEIIGKSLSKQINKLEWWQEIDKNIDKVELIKDLTQFNPELKNTYLKLMHDSILTNSNYDLEKAYFKLENTSIDNLNILGGIDGICLAMKKHNVQPDERFFNTMLLISPNNVESEEKIIDHMKKNNIKINIDFCNFLIRRRLQPERFDLKGADEAFKMIQKNQLTPNPVTFGCLAYKVLTIEQLDEYLVDLKNMGFDISIYNMRILFANGFYKTQRTSFLFSLMNYIKNNGIKVEKEFLEDIENDMQQLKLKIIDMERMNKAKMDKSQLQQYERNRIFYKKFKQFYQNWTKEVKVFTKAHPYAKFARKNDPLYESHIKSSQRYE